MDATTPAMSAKMRGLKKSEFLKTEATPAVKKIAFISLIIFAVIAALVIVATITTNATSLVDLPIITMLMDEDDRKEMKNDLKQSAKQLKDADDLIDEIKEEYDSKTAKVAKDVVKKTKAAAKTLSINNVIALMNSCKKLVKTADDEVVSYMDMDEIVESFEEVADIFSIIRTVTYVFAAIVILLTLWSAFSKIPGLSILCIFLYVPACMLLSSVLLGVLVAVALIALAVTTSRVNKAWKGL